jgi:hypothetical protein
MFRFTIRELVLLTLVVAMGVAWWVSYSASNQRLVHWKAHAMKSVLSKEGWIIEQDGWDFSFRKSDDVQPRYRFGVKWPVAE